MTSTNQDSGAGFAFAIGAYLLWGLLPFYMKAMAHIPAAEVVAHRVIWAIPVAGLVLLVTGRFTDLLVALKTPRMLAMAALTPRAAALPMNSRRVILPAVTRLVI